MVNKKELSITVHLSAFFYALREQAWQNWGKHSNLKHVHSLNILPLYEQSICEFVSTTNVQYDTILRYSTVLPCTRQYKQAFKKHIETHLSSCNSLKPQGWNIFVICQLGITIWIVTRQLTTKLPVKMKCLTLYKSHSLKVEFLKNNKVKGYKIITIRNLQAAHTSSKHKERLLK